MTAWMPDTPAHWRTATIGEATDTKLGRMLNAEARHGPHQVPYLRNENVRWGGFDLSDVNTMSIPPEKQEDYLLQPGDILVCEGGDIGRAAVWTGQSNGGMYFQKALHRIRVGDDLDPTFVRYWLEHLAASNRLLPYATGSTILHLPQQALRKLPLAVPPLDEQREIVEIIERLMSRLASAGREVASARRQINPLRRSALADIFHLRGPHENDRSHWRATTIGEVAEVRLGRQRSPKNHSGDQMRPYLRAANVDRYQLWPEDIQEMNFTDEEMETYALRENDILIVEGSGSAAEVGKCALVPPRFAGHAFQNTLIRVRPGDEVDPRWLMYRINAEAELGRFLALARGVGIFHLGSTRTAKWPIALPPLDEQLVQAERIETELSRTDHLSHVLSQAERSVEPLQRSILKAAFEGRLTHGARTAQSVDKLEEVVG